MTVQNANKPMRKKGVRATKHMNLIVKFPFYVIDKYKKKLHCEGGIRRNLNILRLEQKQGEGEYINKLQ